jgi:hypothetical protein
MGKKIIFTLKVKNANKKKGNTKGRALNFSYLKGQKGAYASSGSACWHVHGFFFEALLTINPEAIVTSMLGTINKDGGNWQDKEIGSPYFGYLNMSELCECDTWDSDVNSDLENTFEYRKIDASIPEKLKTVEVKSIKQSELSGECWLVQFNGLKACETCEYLNTSDCGGKNIRKTLLNEKGKKVPLA